MSKLLAGVVGLVAFMVICVPSMIAILLGQSGGGNVMGKTEAGNLKIQVYLHAQDKIEEMTVESYIKGVLGAEMPAEFEPEALKAQAVAARTYAVKHMRSFGGSGVEGKDADVTTDFTKDQAWLSEDALKERWGKKYNAYKEKIDRAVDETAGRVVVYEDQPISALFHSTSAGRTASAKEVWGYDYPYLQSVECKWDEASPRYRETKEIKLAKVEEALGEDAGIVTAAQGGGEAFKVLSLTESGRVKEMRAGSKTFSGQEIRQQLGLRSDNFTVALKGDALVFETLGYGHGVGMCQYGANGMAKEGKTYEEILKYFYTGVHIKRVGKA